MQHWITTQVPGAITHKSGTAKIWLHSFSNKPKTSIASHACIHRQLPSSPVSTTYNTTSCSTSMLPSRYQHEHCFKMTHGSQRLQHLATCPTSYQNQPYHCYTQSPHQLSAGCVASAGPPPAQSVRTSHSVHIKRLNPPTGRKLVPQLLQPKAAAQQCNCFETTQIITSCEAKALAAAQAGTQLPYICSRATYNTTLEYHPCSLSSLTHQTRTSKIWFPSASTLQPHYQAMHAYTGSCQAHRNHQQNHHTPHHAVPACCLQEYHRHTAAAALCRFKVMRGVQQTCYTICPLFAVS